MGQRCAALLTCPSLGLESCHTAIHAAWHGLRPSTVIAEPLAALCSDQPQHKSQRQQFSSHSVLPPNTLAPS